MSIYRFFSRNAYSLLVLVLFLLFVVRISTEHSTLRNETKPNSSTHDSKTEEGKVTKEALYVLGGTQHSLELKFHAVADLYQKREIKKILISSETGITSFSHKLGRNLTNDEWTIIQLTRQKVRREDINFILLQNGFFGTLREAKTLRNVSLERGLVKLQLVCSSYHRDRVSTTFLAIFENTGIEIDIIEVDDQVKFGSIVVEYVKLLLYKYVLIPLTVR